MHWIILAATLSLATQAKPIRLAKLVEPEIGRIVRVEERNAKVWGMSGMEMVLITETVGGLTPSMRTLMYDARLVEILSSTQSPPLTSGDITVAKFNGKCCIAVRGMLLMQIRPEDARASGMSEAALAAKWQARIADVLPQIAPYANRIGGS